MILMVIKPYHYRMVMYKSTKSMNIIPSYYLIYIYIHVHIITISLIYNHPISHVHMRICIYIHINPLVSLNC